MLQWLKNHQKSKSSADIVAECGEAIFVWGFKADVAKNVESGGIGVDVASPPTRKNVFKVKKVNRQDLKRQKVATSYAMTMTKLNPVKI